MKATITRLAGITFIIFIGAFMYSLRVYSAWDPSTDVCALDIGIFAAAASLFMQSLAGLVYNNLLFQQQNKDWRDFWSGDVLEYFYKSNPSRPVWMLARGKFILYFLTCVLSIGMLIIYINIRH